MLQRGQGLFYVLATGLIAVVLATLRQLPPGVASHFDAAGVPNGWSSRPVYVVLLLGIGVLLPLGIVGLINGLTRTGPARLNIPARDYYTWWLGCVMAGTALLIHWSVVAANAQVPPRLETSAVLLVLVTALLGLGGWTAGWYRLLRPPRSG